MTTKKLVPLAAAMAVIGVGGGTQILSASASSVAPATGPFESVSLPSGVELPLSQVEGIARSESAQAGEASPSMSVGRGTLAAAMKMIDASTTFPEATGQVGTMLSEQVILVVMHGNFRLTVGTRLPKGGGVAVGSILDLVIDAHTGGIVGRALPLEEPRGEGVALAAVASAVAGVVSGRLTHTGSGRRVFIETPARAHPTLKLATSTGGRFRVHLRPGAYVVVSKRCTAKHLVVQAGRTTHVTLACNK